MKKIFIKLLFLLINIVFVFSQAFSSFSDYMNSNNPKVNLYWTLTKYYKEQLKKVDQIALRHTAQDYGTSPDTIKDILNGYTSQCIGILKKLNIKECDEDDKNAKFSCLEKCFEKVKDTYERYKQTNISLTIIGDSLIGENTLSDGDPKNGSYDLIVDINNISKMLFKKKLKFKFWNKISMRQSTDINLGGILGGNSNSNSNVGIQDSNSINNREDNSNDSNNSSSGANSTGNSTTNNELLIRGSNSSFDTANTNNNTSNSYFQIGNVCDKRTRNTENTNETNSNKEEYNPIEGISSDPDTPLNSNGCKGTTFNVFDGKGEKAGLVGPTTGIVDSLTNSTDLTNSAGSTLAGGKGVCGLDDKKILSICVKLIPSGPRGSVGGTVKFKTVEEIIKKIDDELKDIKQSFIIPSGHGDEALGIDFKHIKLAKIMSFNLVLTKKPVFQYKRNNISDTPGKSDQGDEKDSPNCPNIPRFLGNMYTNVGIVNCNSPIADVNKYLMSNKDSVKPIKWEFSTSYLGTDKTDSTEGQAKVENNFLEFINITKKFFSNLDQLLFDWQEASVTLAGKSK